MKMMKVSWWWEFCYILSGNNSDKTLEMNSYFIAHSDSYYIHLENA